MECNSRRNLWIVTGVSGQSTVEYAIVLGTVLCVVVAIGLLANAVDTGVFIQHALMAASHNVSGSAGGAVDVFSF